MPSWQKSLEVQIHQYNVFSLSVLKYFCKFVYSIRPIHYSINDSG